MAAAYTQVPFAWVYLTGSAVSLLDRSKPLPQSAMGVTGNADQDEGESFRITLHPKLSVEGCSACRIRPWLSKG